MKSAQLVAQNVGRPENPFLKARQIVVSPVEEKNIEESKLDSGSLTSNNFRPFDASASSEGKSPSIFDKLDRQSTPSQMMVAQMENAAA